MIRKVFAVVLALVFCIPVISYASKDYALELDKEQKKLIKLKAQVTEENKKLKKLAREYEGADKAMRQQLFKDKSTIDKKAFIRESKMEQEKLRSNYYENKAPLAKEYNRLKKERDTCKRNIKRLTKKIDHIANYPDNEAYKAKVKKLESQISDRKEKHDNAVVEVRENADSKIAAITDMGKKSVIKKQILSDAKDKELELRKKYAADKAVIVAEINAAKSEYKKNSKLWRIKKDAEKKEEQLKKMAAKQKKTSAQPAALEEGYKKEVNTNFNPVN